jgi:quercetin dioxygenase-like cupin family protein
MDSKHTPGERIAEIRGTYSVSRETLAERSGLPLELIRRIEEDGLIPDLAPLLKISRALGVRMGTLLDDREELGPVVTRAGRAGETSRFITGIPNAEGSAASRELEAQHNAEGLVFHALAADKGGRHMEPFIIDVHPSAVQEKSTHEGEEFIYILAGLIEIDYGKDHYSLEAGDSIYYDSIVPHRVMAGGNADARILAVIYTPA